MEKICTCTLIHQSTQSINMNIEQQYLDLLRDILENGEEKIDRTGVGTLSVFGRQLRANLTHEFPAITTKKLAWKAVVSELLWFIEGSGDERRLAEILHGTRDSSKTTIWTANSQADYWKPKAKFDGDLGRVYGVQWRTWKQYNVKYSEHDVEHNDGSKTHFRAKVSEQVIDQLALLINDLKHNPASRRMILTAWNPAEISDMALPPCHMFAQFHVNQKTERLSCQLYIRSNDIFLGAPFNIASYALLTCMLAQVTGWIPGDLVYTIGDAHVYLNHTQQAWEQLTRIPYNFPTLKMDIKDMFTCKVDDFKLVDYVCHPSIKAEMAV